MTVQRRIRVIVIGASLAALAAPLAAQRVMYDVFTDPSNRYAVEFPRGWKWTIVKGAGEALATFVHPNSEAAVVVERFRMKVPLNQDEITDIFSSIEVDWLKENQPNVMDVNARIEMQGRRKVVQIDYRRPGIGDPGKRVEDERVRQFSFPVGGSVIRITCASLASQFGRFEAIFQRVAESLKSGDDLAKK